MNPELSHTTIDIYSDPKAVWPTDLKTVAEVAASLRLKKERILELVANHCIPHFRIDGGEPLFQITQTKKWAARNLVHHIEGCEMPIFLRVMVDPPLATDAPPVIREINNLRRLPALEFPPGVYFLVDGNEVVYIGQSVNPLSRIYSHTDKKYSHAYMVPVPSSSLDAVEGALIRTLKPKYNGGQNRVRGSLHAPGDRNHDLEILREFKFDPIVESQLAIAGQSSESSEVGAEQTVTGPEVCAVPATGDESSAATEVEP